MALCGVTLGRVRVIRSVPLWLCFDIVVSVCMVFWISFFVLGVVFVSFAFLMLFFLILRCSDLLIVIVPSFDCLGL